MLGAVFAFGLALSFSFQAQGGDASATIVFTRLDCVKHLAANRNAPANSLGFSVVKHGSVRKSEVTTLEGLNYLTAQAARIGINLFLGAYNQDSSASVPGGSVVKEEFQFSPGQTRSTLQIQYELKLGEKQNTGGVHWNLEGVFIKGDWDQFMKGNEVEFQFTPSAWACVDRMVGPHVDSRNSTSGEQVFMLLKCLGESAEANQTQTSTTAPARFFGTRHKLLFEGPASVVQMQFGSRG